jgi:trimeric autotransporter adhesin
VQEYKFFHEIRIDRSALKRAARGGFMRRFLTLGILLCLAIPAGVTITGCIRNPAGAYCNGLGYGPKLTAVNAISLQPATTGVSLAFGTEQQIASPVATTCKGQSASVSSYQYGTTNNQLVDISPGGNLCAGTWNRNSSGGIPNYTICSLPNPLPDTGGLPYGIVYITASAGGVTSNPVTIYVHPKTTSVALYGPPTCLSQGQTSQLDGQACYSIGATQYELCAPASIAPADYTCPLPAGVSSVPSCSGVIGAFNYQSGNTSIFTIDQYGVLTSVQPGTAAVTASISGTGASAGYVSTCPPRSIQILLNGQTSGTVTQGVTQNLTTTATDILGNPIVGLALNYQSTNVVDVTASATGGVAANFPGTAAIYAVCQPSNCNPAPINEVGVQGTGLSISSNSVNITVPGTATTYAWFGAPNQSQYFSQVELLTGTVGATVRTPYLPNSMAMDALGSNIYMGNSHELMIYTASSNSLSKEDNTVPGVVLAVSPDNTMVLINDQIRNVFYIYRPSGGTSQTYGGLGVAATWTPDSRTLYVVDEASAGGAHTDALYTYTFAYGWNSFSLAPTGGAQSIALTVPSVGAYLAGPTTVAHTWCVAGPVGSYAGSEYYPQGDSLSIPTDALASTTDGLHIIGAAYDTATTATLSDIGVNVTAGSSVVPGTNVTNYPGQCPSVDEYLLAAGDGMPALELTHTLNQTTLTFASNAASVNQVVASKTTVGSASQNLSFFTYLPPSSGATTGATLPYYITSPTGPGVLGTVGYVTLTGATNITAPVAGAFSPDNSLFFVSTSGDNLVHYINVDNVINNTTPQDTQTINPGLLDTNGNPVPATVVVVKPRATT